MLAAVLNTNNVPAAASLVSSTAADASKNQTKKSSAAPAPAPAPKKSNATSKSSSPAAVAAENKNDNNKKAPEQHGAVKKALARAEADSQRKAITREEANAIVKNTLDEAEAKNAREQQLQEMRRIDPNLNFLDPNVDQEGMEFDIQGGLGNIDQLSPTEQDLLSKRDFRHSWPNAPHPAMIKGSHIMEWKLLNKQVSMADGSRSPMTFKLHFRFLNELQRMLRLSDKAWLEMPLAVIAIRMLQRNNEVRNWQPQTLFRNACALQGALGALPIYSDQPMKIQIGLEPIWQLLMTTWRLKANQAQPHNQTIATIERINAALAAVELNDLRTMAAIILQWYLGARVGDVLNLKWKDLELTQLRDGILQLKATISEGKVISKRGPYTVPTLIPQQHARLLLQYFRTASHLGQTPHPSARLFPSQEGKPGAISHNHQQKLIRQALKKAHPQLCTRAIRRGSLQAMADAGVDHETLMVFSGHTDVKTLLRYLNWGRNAGAQIQRANQAATHLAPRNLSSQH